MYHLGYGPCAKTIPRYKRSNSTWVKLIRQAAFTQLRLDIRCQLKFWSVLLVLPNETQVFSHPRPIDSKARPKIYYLLLALKKKIKV